ncbi:hypothetical protein [Shinella sp.]|uniref:hypothetical protein n=1 Tax=Shinella sp. TaxID=1870904 RepID=UPI0029B2EF26|nr:hypothetical protein [Shinella sp.]MDX3973309.1 hypothetical protein [Shinella sp.]
MVDNVKNAPERELEYVLGVDALGKGGKQLASDFAGPGGGAGTVTSVGLTVPTGFSIGSSPVTSSGTMALTYAPGYQSFTTGEATKVGYLSITGSINLDTVKAKTDYLTVTAATDLDAIRNKVNALDAALVLAGTFAPSTGVFPGGGTSQRGDVWIATDNGTIAGIAIKFGDRVTALVDNASTTVFTGNWFHEDYTNAVLSINGLTGAVLIEGIIVAATAKTTPVDADLFGIVDSAASNVLKKVSWANIKATLKAYFDTLYQAADAAIAKLNIAQAWTKGQRSTPVSLSITGGVTNAWLLANSNVFKLPLTVNAQLSLPTDIATYVDQAFFLVVTQDGTGGHALTYASGYLFANDVAAFDVAPGANKKTLISGYVLDSSTIVLGAIGAGVAL